MNIPDQEKMNSLLKKAGVPDLNDLMGGYILDGNKMRANINYWVSDDVTVVAGSLILLYSKKSRLPSAYNSTDIETTLTLEIMPPAMAFIYFLTDHQYSSSGVNIILPNKKQEVKFKLKSRVEDTILNAGDLLGYGVFIPIIPNDNIKFNKQENAT